MSTPFAVYLASAISTTLATASKLYSTLGTPGAVNHASLVSTGTGWVELWSKGNAAATLFGSIQAPTGNGFLYDVSSLEGQQILAGNWSSILRLQAVQSGVGAGSLGGDLHVRVYKYNTGVYTTILDMALPAQTVGSAQANYSLGGVTSLATAFTTNDKLYVDLWLNVTSNANASSVQGVRVQNLSTDIGTLTGNANASVTSPGFLPVNAAFNSVAIRMVVRSPATTLRTVQAHDGIFVARGG